jgi:signal transduction histidine kinase
MAHPGKRARSFRIPPRTLRLRLTLLYAAVFCGCAAVLGAATVIFKPGFLVHSGYQRAGGHPQSVNRSWDGSLGSFLAGFTAHHDVGGGLAMIAILVVIAAGAGWLIAGRVVRPLRAITSSARAISASSLHQRLALAGHDDEIAELGATLDNLFARLEAAFESQRRFVANASHELRTPLSAGRALLQVALTDPDATVASLRDTCQEVLDLDDQQERLIGALLTLATSQRGLERSEPLDLGGITRKILLARQHEAGRKGIQVSTAVASAPVTGDPHLAESLIANLVDNAIRYNVAGGQVEVSTEPAAEGAVLSVRNTGPAIPPDEVDRLFEPFRQFGTERTRHGQGHGLGLAIVRAIADAHDAALTAQARPKGGLDITVTFTARPMDRGLQPVAGPSGPNTQLVHADRPIRARLRQPG